MATGQIDIQKLTWYGLLSSTTLTTSYVTKETYNSRKFSDYNVLNFVCWRGNWIIGTATVPRGRFAEDATGLALVFKWGSEEIEYDCKFVDDTHVQVKKITSSTATIQLQIHGFTIA